jgi:hypothetical protein
MIAFAAGLSCTSLGLWLLYRNLLYGDAISLTIVFLSAMMMGSGILLLSPPRQLIPAAKTREAPLA